MFLATAKLRAALGTLTASELGLDVIFYDADRALQDTRWKLFGTDLDSETERGKKFLIMRNDQLKGACKIMSSCCCELLDLHVKVMSYKI